jgi:ammonium transporter Rh
MESYYPLYQDVHVMIFIGFGFLMTFVSRYAWSAVGFNFLLSALAIQWALLTDAFFHAAQLNKWNKASVNIVSLINADFAAASLMITFGALLGKTSALREYRAAVSWARESCHV